jgi:hypothetical protein
MWCNSWSLPLWADPVKSRLLLSIHNSQLFPMLRYLLVKGLLIIRQKGLFEPSRWTPVKFDFYPSALALKSI